MTRSRTKEKAANERPFLLMMMVVPSMMVVMRGTMVVMRPHMMMVGPYMMVVTPRVMAMLDLLNQTTFMLNRYRRQWRRVGIYHANTEAQHYTEK